MTIHHIKRLIFCFCFALGCFNPNLPNHGEITCGPGGDCPEGQQCCEDNGCWGECPISHVQVADMGIFIQDQGRDSSHQSIERDLGDLEEPDMLVSKEPDLGPDMGQDLGQDMTPPAPDMGHDMSQWEGCRPTVPDIYCGTEKVPEWADADSWCSARCGPYCRCREDYCCLLF